MGRRSRAALAGLAIALLAAPVLSAAPPGRGAPPPACDREAFVVAIDVGHSPRTQGAISARGVPEWEFNLALAELIHRRLRELGFSRSFLVAGENPLRQRPRAAAEGGADLLVSIHHDSVQPRFIDYWSCERGSRQHYCDLYRGHSLFLSRKNPRYAESLRFAQLLGQALLDRELTPTLHHAMPIDGERKELVDQRRGVHLYDNLVVLREAPMPALLFEGGVIVHREEEQLLQSPEHRHTLADAFGVAVSAYCEGSRADPPRHLAAAPRGGRKPFPPR